MTQIILFTTPNNGIAVCKPTGEKSIEQVLAEDCPSGAWITDESVLPTGEGDFFDAWEWNGSNIVVNLDKAKDFYTTMINKNAAQQAGQRSINASIGLANNETDQQFINRINTARSAIQSATSTADLRAIRI